MKSILDRSFRYTPSSETDLRKTFARVKREQLKQGTTSTVSAPASSTVHHLPARTTKGRT